MARCRRGYVALLAAVALTAGACGGGGASGGDTDPVATAEDPALVLTNSQYPELPVDGLRSKYLLDTGEHLTHVLSFVDGLRLDETAAIEALRYFERFRREVVLDVEGESPLTYNVRPRNYPQRYVVIVPDGVPLPRWAGRPEEGRSFASTRPVNVDHAVTVVRLAAKPFLLGPLFEALAPAAQLDSVFLAGACARSASITTDEAAAYKYGANIHNQGEGVICGAETRLLSARLLRLATPAAAELVAANRTPPPPIRGPTLVAPAFDERRYAALPSLTPIFALP